MFQNQNPVRVFYITIFLKETDCLQKMKDVIFISICVQVMSEKAAFVSGALFCVRVTGETSLSTPPAPPAGREYICIYMLPQIV